MTQWRIALYSENIYANIYFAETYYHSHTHPHSCKWILFYKFKNMQIETLPAEQLFLLRKIQQYYFHSLFLFLQHIYIYIYIYG